MIRNHLISYPAFIVGKPLVVLLHASEIYNAEFRQNKQCIKKIDYKSSLIIIFQDGSVHVGAVGMYRGTGSVMEFDQIGDTTPTAKAYSEIANALPRQTDGSYLGDVISKKIVPTY